MSEKYGQKEIPFPDIEELKAEEKQKSISFGDAMGKIAQAGKPKE